MELDVDAVVEQNHVNSIVHKNSAAAGIIGGNAGNNATNFSSSSTSTKNNNILSQEKMNSTVLQEQEDHSQRFSSVLGENSMISVLSWDGQEYDNSKMLQSEGVEDQLDLKQMDFLTNQLHSQSIDSIKTMNSDLVGDNIDELSN